MKRRDLATIYLFLQIYAVVLCIFSFYRFILFIIEFERLGDANFMLILQSFLIGVRFDVVIASYILFLPFLITSVYSFFNKWNHLLKKSVFYFIYIVFTIAFLVSAADIPYFSHFFSRFSVSAFEWFDTPGFIIKMIFQESRYWLYLLMFLAILIIFYFVLKKIFSNLNFFVKFNNLYFKLLFSILALGLIFLGIRGRIEKKSPIRTGTAYFSNNAFLNQLGLNPNFTLMRSYLDGMKDINSSINLMNNNDAINHLQEYLEIQTIDSVNPISRHVTFGLAPPIQHNVIIIIMEGMSASKMTRHGNKNNLTKFLDSISNEGIYFENCYSAGIHTFNGVFSTLFSFPAIFRQHPMKESSMKSYQGIASTLKENGYSTLYFTTHDGQFDNIDGFLRHNQFERIIEKKEYPKDKIKTTVGVPDDYMFEFSIPLLNEYYLKGKPFLSVFMTASDHGPYYIPDYFKPNNDEIKNQIVEYADFSLNKFITLAKKQQWFENTLFVFIADHGASLSSDYDISLDYVHVPLLFYGPEILKEKKVLSKMAGQIDVYPSIMGLLKIPYQNTTMGINLLADERPFIFFNVDDKYGVINQDWFLICRTDKSQSLHKYRSKDKYDYSKENPEIVSSMKTYAESHLQTFQYMLDKVLK